MLEKSVWRQYHDTNNFREVLAQHTKLSFEELIEDEKLLYAAMKAKLTKKELKLLAMESAGVDDEHIKAEFEYSDEDLHKAKYKLHKKLIQDKTRLAFRQKTLQESATTEA